MNPQADQPFRGELNVSGCRKNGSMTGTRDALDALEQLRSALAGVLAVRRGIRVVRRRTARQPGCARGARPARRCASRGLRRRGRRAFPGRARRSAPLDPHGVPLGGRARRAGDAGLGVSRRGGASHSGRRTRARSGFTGEAIEAAFPQVAAALAAGELGTDAAGTIIRELDRTRPVADPASFAAAEQALVAEATGRGDGAPVRCTADELRVQAQAWSTFLDQDGPEPDDERAMRRRGLRLGRARDGLIPVTGRAHARGRREAHPALRRAPRTTFGRRVHDRRGTHTHRRVRRDAQRRPATPRRARRRDRHRRPLRRAPHDRRRRTHGPRQRHEPQTSPPAAASPTPTASRSRSRSAPPGT